VTAAPSFCARCGRPLEHGRCPLHDAPARTRGLPTFLATLAIGLAILVALGGTVTSLWLRSDLRSTRAELRSLAHRVRSQQAELSELNRSVATLMRPSPTPQLQDVAAEVRDSVFTVRTEFGQATAWVIRSVGGVSTLITNYHVVAGVWRLGGRSVEVVRGSGTFPGTIHEVSIAEDLAAIEVDATFQPLQVGTSRPDVGEPVLVVGSPFGFQRTVATGVVSAIRPRFIQFSAPVSPGDSGAPLVNDRGEVLGVVARKVFGGGAEGLSFAIPIQTVCRTVVTC